MPRFGINIFQYFQSHYKKFSKRSVYDFGIRVLELLKTIHAAGFIYNDIKLENILLGIDTE
jgi:serine/threonine protein kinase